MRRYVLLKRLYHLSKLISKLPGRNAKRLDNNPVIKKQVNLEWVDNGNLGDTLGPVIYKWMLDQHGIKPDLVTKKTYHLYTCGSLVGVGYFNATIWGSGAHIVPNIKSLLYLNGIRKYDIRAVRGPVTRRILLDCGYDCPEVYGDPAIIMPLIYNTDTIEKKYDVSVVLHYYLKNSVEYQIDGCHYIDIETSNYKKFIDEVKASKLIISSSLHGIILAEAYGVPAIFLNTGGYVDRALMKYYDWYFSTNRWNVKMAKTIDEALAIEPMPLPDLSVMREKLLAVFPYDLWGQ